MTTGPEHYRISEALLRRVEVESLDDGSVLELLGRAQVHATLAQAAATALSHDRMMPTYDSEAWLKVARTPRPS